MPDTVVQARSEEQGTLRTTRTDREGRFRLEALAPGVWTVQALGETRTVTLALQQTVRLVLTVGARLEEQVTVTAAPPMVDPQRTGGELRVGGETAEELPMAGRAVTDLALLDASVRGRSPGSAAPSSWWRGSRVGPTRSWWTASTTTTR